jgi:hypothetical protein
MLVLKGQNGKSVILQELINNNKNSITFICTDYNYPKTIHGNSVYFYHNDIVYCQDRIENLISYFKYDWLFLYINKPEAELEIEKDIIIRYLEEKGRIKNTILFCLE